MKASKVIKTLEKLIQKYGDVKCEALDDMPFWMPFANIYYDDEYKVFRVEAYERYDENQNLLDDDQQEV